MKFTKPIQELSDSGLETRIAMCENRRSELNTQLATLRNRIMNNHVDLEAANLEKLKRLREAVAKAAANEV